MSQRVRPDRNGGAGRCLGPDTAAALACPECRTVAAYVRCNRVSTKPDDGPFADEKGKRLPRITGEQFLSDLRKAKTVRPGAFGDGDQRKPIRVNDLRATFVTVRLASGRTSHDIKKKPDPSRCR